MRRQIILNSFAAQLQALWRHAAGPEREKIQHRTHWSVWRRKPTC